VGSPNPAAEIKQMTKRKVQLIGDLIILVVAGVGSYLCLKYAWNHRKGKGVNDRGR
jgi:hypothetical protein